MRISSKNATRAALRHSAVAALGLAFIALASWIFVRVHRYAVRHGLIARYSAESVT